MGAESNKGGRGQRNREEIRASPPVRSARVVAALPLSNVPDKAAMLRRLLNAIMHMEGTLVVKVAL